MKHDDRLRTWHPLVLSGERRDVSYRIRVAGRLGPEWDGWVEGMTVEVDATPGTRTTTVLTGTIPDMAALMGLLERLCTRGATLLALEFLDDGCDDLGA